MLINIKLTTVVYHNYGLLVHKVLTLR